MQPEIQKILKSFFIKFQAKSFVKGKTVIIGGKDRRVFFLTRGVVRMFSIQRGTELTLNIYKQYALFPMALVLNNQKDRYKYDALTDVEGYFAPKKEFEKFLNKNPKVLFDLLGRIYRGLEGFFMRMETLLSGDAHFRILTQLVIYSRRFGQSERGRITFDWHLTHQELASQTGLARETVTKEIKKLQDKGFVGYIGKKLVIYDLPSLEEECFVSS